MNTLKMAFVYAVAGIGLVIVTVGVVIFAAATGIGWLGEQILNSAIGSRE